ncbi:hypothetical protein JXJ21_25410 [candidate division KSB1 bacterium]|nr:hypothetical protein [candidate division KSB1 bacterium]
MSSPRIRRLQSDYQRLKSQFNGWSLIKLRAAIGTPPEKYQIEYNIRGIYATPDGRLLERHQHLLEIKLGLEYPRRPPQCRLLTPIFHPNFNATEVCTQDSYAASEGLDDLIIRIGRMIAYQSYNTKSPLNGLAAKWAAKHSSKLPVDPREIAPPIKKAASEEHPISILGLNSDVQKNQKSDSHEKDFCASIANGVNLIQNKRYDDALEIFNAIIEDDIILRNAYYYRAIIKNKTGNDRSAISDFIIAAKLGHDNAKAILERMKIKY